MAAQRSAIRRAFGPKLAHRPSAAVIQGVFLPYEEPRQGAEAATLESYLRLIKFRQPAVERTMGKDGPQWFAQRWQRLQEARQGQSPGQALGHVKALIADVLDKLVQREHLRKEIQPWAGDDDIDAKSGGVDVAATYRHKQAFRHYYQEIKLRDDLLRQDVAGWSNAWSAFSDKAVKLLQANAEDEAHAGIARFVDEFVNPNLKKTAEPKDVIRAMPEAEQEALLALFKTEIGAAIAMVGRLRADDKIIASVFQAQGSEIADVKNDLSAIEAQLWEWRWQKKSKVVLDKNGTSAAGGTSATANQRTGSLDLTRVWAAKSGPLERQQTLIHEASHASAVKTKDLAYMWGWAYLALDGKEKRRNADSYAEATRRLHGADVNAKHLTFAQKPASTPNDPRLLELTKKGLGEMDRVLARARTLSGNMATLLKLNPETRLDRDWWDFARMLGAPFTGIQWEEGKAKDKYGITNADLETLMMFRDSLKDVHVLIESVSALEIVPKADTVEIDSNALMMGETVLLGSADPQRLALQMIRLLYRQQVPGLPWSDDVVPPLLKIVDMTANWRSIEPAVPDEKVDDKRTPDQKNAIPIEKLTALWQKAQAWWKTFYPDQGEPRPPFFDEAYQLSGSLKRYIAAAQGELRTRTLPELIRSNALQALEVRFNEIGRILASARQGREGSGDKVHWKRLKGLSAIAHQAREVWIGRPDA